MANLHLSDIYTTTSDLLSSSPLGDSCVHTECTLHQLSPYIGKIKSSIASLLIEKFSEPDDLIADPFSGSGTIPLEAILMNRDAFAADNNPYAKILNLGKFDAPTSLDDALLEAENILWTAKNMDRPDLRKVPKWVRSFFHPKTLREIMNFTCVCKNEEHYFHLSCLLGILHHERPGFLSYPSSHLVPYIKSAKFPKDTNPYLYTYRDLEGRILSKIKRAYKRVTKMNVNNKRTFVFSDIESLSLPENFDCLITSPPYMNTLNYFRDNRLRLWFIDPSLKIDGFKETMNNKNEFERGIISLAAKVNINLRLDGYAVIIIGERTKRTGSNHPANIVKTIFNNHAPNLRLCDVYTDQIPDKRRARRYYTGSKIEQIILYKKESE